MERYYNRLKDVDYKKIKSTQKNMCFLLDKIKDKYI